jgi:asparagine synthase (glutamine-hydrolysing)
MAHAAMKLQFGQLYTDGRPQSAASLATLLGPYGNDPAETSGELVIGPLAMAFRGDRITEEEEQEIQPLRIGPYLITFDGRLDNREELISRLGRTHRGAPDPALIAHAYDRFGTPNLRELIGEFALTIACPKTQSVLFARSTCGARTLYYTLGKDTLTWCSDFAHLVRVAVVDRTVNNDFAIRYLVATPCATQTALAEVHAVAPNCVLTFKDGHFQTRGTLWDPTGIQVLCYRSDADYEEHCRVLLAEAVRVRLRSKFPVFSELSGGFDSSTVVLMADEVRKHIAPHLTPLQTLSCVCESSLTADESGFIRAVEAHRGIPGMRVTEQDQGNTLGLDDPQFTGVPNPLHCVAGRYPKFISLMKAHQARVLLTGQGGDFLFWSAPAGAAVAADELHHRRLRGVHRECSTWSRAAGIPYYRLLAGQVLPLVAGGRWLRRSELARHSAPSWLSRPQEQSLTFEILDVPEKTTGLLPSLLARLVTFERMFSTHGGGYFAEYPELYVTHPYTHRPLVEFCLAVPISQHLRDGQTRSLMRRALRDVLPPKILRRNSKGLLDEAIVRALKREWNRVGDFHRWQICERGYVQPKAFGAELSRARLGFCDRGGCLSRIFSLERWLRSLNQLCNTAPAGRNAPAPIPTRPQPVAI